jgi:hypothetical protein
VRLREVDRMREGAPVGVEVIGGGHALGHVGDAKPQRRRLRGEGLQNIKCCRKSSNCSDPRCMRIEILVRFVSEPNEEATVAPVEVDL